MFTGCVKCCSFADCFPASWRRNSEIPTVNRACCCLVGSHGMCCGDGREPRNRLEHRNYDQENEKKTKTLTGSYQTAVFSNGPTSGRCWFVNLKHWGQTNNGCFQLGDERRRRSSRIKQDGYGWRITIKYRHFWLYRDIKIRYWFKQTFFRRTLGCCLLWVEMRKNFEETQIFINIIGLHPKFRCQVEIFWYH